MKCIHGDLSIEDWIWRFIPFQIFVHGDLSVWDIFQRFFLFVDVFSRLFILKMFSWRFFHWILKCKRFIPFKRFVHGDFSFEDLFRRFFLLWSCVHGYLSIEDWSVGDLSFFEDLFMEICSLRIHSRDFSFYDVVFMENYPFLKICLGRFVI